MTKSSAARNYISARVLCRVVCAKEERALVCESESLWCVFFRKLKGAIINYNYLCEARLLWRGKQHSTARATHAHAYMHVLGSWFKGEGGARSAKEFYYHFCSELSITLQIGNAKVLESALQAARSRKRPLSFPRSLGQVPSGLRVEVLRR